MYPCRAELDASVAVAVGHRRAAGVGRASPDPSLGHGAFDRNSPLIEGGAVPVGDDEDPFAPVRRSHIGRA
jgi:hypothetical protein